MFLLLPRFSLHQYESVHLALLRSPRPYLILGAQQREILGFRAARLERTLHFTTYNSNQHGLQPGIFVEVACLK